MLKLIVGAGVLLQFTLLAQSPKKVVVTGLTPAAVQELQNEAAGARLVAVSREQLAREIVDADAVLGGVNAGAFRSAKRLKWVQTYSAGVEGQLFPEFRASDVTLTNGKIIQGPEIADHAMALLLGLTRSLYQTIPARASEKWTAGQHQPIELNGKTAVIVGVGGIGMQIAQRAHAFGMRVIGVDPKDISYTYFIGKMAPPDRLDAVLPQADVVFVSAPLTPQSEKIMGARQFGLMKPNSYFIVVSRGRLYDTDALVEALQSKRLAGAGLDVTDPEPLPPGHPLWKFDNVLITPHIAGTSDRIQERRMELLKDNLRRFVAGEPLLNVVDKQRGY
jgi:phosphoglycerate dehydrogenase-like enzyme